MPEQSITPDGIKLTEAQQKQVASHFTFHTCQLCGQKNWTVIDRVVELRNFSSGSLVLGLPTIPIGIVVCNNCKQMALVSLVALGVLPGGD